MAIAAAIPVAEKRRQRRVPSKVKTRCRLNRMAEEGTWQAMVRNISYQGIGLSVNRPIKVGMLLAVELPTNPMETGTTRLIRVKRVEPQPDGKWWSVGGVFAKNLTQIELDLLRIRTPNIVPNSERRTTIRHTTRLKRPVPVIRIIEEGPWLATIRNVSIRGIGLITERPFKPGTYLTIELPVNGGKLGKARLLKITHLSRQKDSPWWVLGGSFLSRLTPDEYESLV